jgi:hypothetical protein
MTQTFEYGTARIKDLRVISHVNDVGKTVVDSILLNDEPVSPTPRFWNSLHVRFGFTSNIFRYFSHAEVFERISSVSPCDEIRWCLQRDENRRGSLLAVTNPSAAIIRHDELLELLQENDTKAIRYDKGVVTSEHEPRLNPTFQIGGDGFRNKFIIDTPIDGYGRPAVYLSMLRLICSNGLVGYSPTFRSELAVGRGDGGVRFSLQRVLDGFNNEDGYAALRQRFEAATRSWASVNEAQKLYKVLVRLHGRGDISNSVSRVTLGGDGASEFESSPLFSSFHRMTGDLSQIYGLASLDTLSVKRQRTLPSACKVYDLLNFASEAATHHATEAGNKTLQAYIGELISGEYDLEGTVDQFTDWRDFFIGNEQTASTLADLHRRSV